MSEKPRVLFVVGPTACGKSDFAVQASEASGLPLPEIINCDSIQFFKGVDIGAAKPEPELLARVPHHLIGTVELGASYTAGDFRRDALGLIGTGQSRNQSRFAVVGGSGFYVQALQKGMFEVAEIPDDVRLTLEREREEKGLEALYRELQTRDPETAAKIQPADPYRILRSLEILRFMPGETLSGIRARFQAQAPEAPFEYKTIGLFRSRDILRRRVAERTAKMLELGLIKEVEALRAKGLTEWAPLKSVGYKEVQLFLDGKLSFEELAPLIITSTMQLAKRQMTWFKRDSQITWFDSELGFAAPLALAKEFLLGPN